MPRRKIGADLKEAICKLYEAGDISAETIEKHGIMSRATFFRNLKLYKAGVSLEQRHSTGRKTNADKLREQEKQEFDCLQPTHLEHLELVLIDERNVTGAARPKKKGKSAVNGESGKGKKRDEGSDSLTIGDDVAQSELSESETESDDDRASLIARQDLDRLFESARAFLRAGDSSAQSSNFAFSEIGNDLDSLVTLEDSQYSHRNRGAMFIVRSARGDFAIVAALALRSLIWTPQTYQSLGQNYASGSIDKVCSLSRIFVHPSWRLHGIGRWLVRVAELKASKLGFSHLLTQSYADRIQILEFWRKSGLNEHSRFNNMVRFEKVVTAIGPKRDSKRMSSQGDLQVPAASSNKRSKLIHPALLSGSEAYTAELSAQQTSVPKTITSPPLFDLPSLGLHTSTSALHSSTQNLVRALQQGPPPRKIAFQEITAASDPKASKEPI